MEQRVRLHQLGAKLLVWRTRRFRRSENLAIVNLSSGFWDQDLDYKSNHFTTRSASIMPPIR